MRRTCSAFAAAVLALAVPGASLAQEPPVRFLDSTDDLSDGSATFTVENRTEKAARVTIALRWTGLVDPEGRPVTAARAFTFSPSVTVPGDGDSPVTVTRVPTQALKLGTYAGRLRLRTAAGVTDVMRLSLTVAAGGAKAAVATPAVKAWRSEAVWHAPDAFPGPDGWTYHDLRVPLLRADGVAAQKDVATATLQGSNGGTVVVTGDIVADEGAEPYLQLRYQAGNERAPTGTYTGSIDVLPDDDKSGDVALTLVRKHSVWLPLGVLLLSLALAFALNRWLTCGRARFAAWRDTGAALDLIGAEQGPLPLTGIDDARRAAKRKRKAVRCLFATKDSAELAAMEADVAAVIEAQQAWTSGALARKVTGLRDALDAMPSPATPPGAVGEQPPFVAATRALTTGEVNVSGIVARQDAVTKATAFVQTWTLLVTQATLYGTVLDKLAAVWGLTPRQHQLRETARLLHAGVVWDLWHTTDAADLARRAAAAELDRADSIIGQLSPLLATTEEMTGERAAFLDGESIGVFGAVAAALEDLTSAPAVIRAFSEGVARTLDLATVAVAVLVAVVAALPTLYFGKVFGTAQDYLSLVAWGLGTATALEVVNAALGKVAPRKETTVVAP